MKIEGLHNINVINFLALFNIPADRVQSCFDFNALLLDGIVLLDACGRNQLVQQDRQSVQHEEVQYHLFRPRLG